MEKVFININEASLRYSLPTSWFYARTRAGAIPFLKCGKYLRFRVVELDSWFEKSCSLKFRIDKKSRS